MRFAVCRGLNHKPDMIYNVHNKPRGCGMKTVVLIDDDLGVLEHLSALLKNHPAFSLVATARSGREGKFVITHFLPDLIILDIMMPDDDGLSVIKHVREKCGQYNPFVYIITALDTQLIQNVMINDFKVDFFEAKQISNMSFIQNLDYVSMSEPKAIGEHTREEKKYAVNTVDAVMAEFKIPSHLSGYNYIKTALYLMIDDPSLTRNIYSKIATTYSGASERSILKAIKRAIEASTESERYRTEFGKDRVENLVFINQLSVIVGSRLQGCDSL